MQHADADIPPDLLDTAMVLEQHRPRMTEPENDRVLRCAVTRGSRIASSANRSPKGSFMRSRIAIMATLVTGLVFSSGGAALGVTALTSTDSAAVAEYGTSAADVGGSSDDAPIATLGSGARSAAAKGGAGSAEPADAQTPAGSADAQTPRQLSAAGASRLPFTGYASIPLMLAGLALLVAGLLLRRSANRLPA